MLCRRSKNESICYKGPMNIPAPTSIAKYIGGKAVLSMVVLIMILAGCKAKEAPSAANAPKKAIPAVPVVIAQVTQKKLPVQIQVIGNVEPFSVVSIKARIDGLIFKAHFKEGQFVHKGDLLFDIDPRDLESQLKLARATLEKDKAQLEFARAEENRYNTLFQEEVISKEMYTQMHTNMEAATSVVAADEAAVESAKVKLDYCKITSPIDGRTGKLLIYEGNMIKANDVTPLVVINQVSPIYITFAVPEKFLDTIRKYKATAKLNVVASVPSGAEVTGELVFIDNTVDTTTGTIKLKASFLNKENQLWPGQFVNVSLILYEQPDAVTIPSQALQVGPNGQYVFVIKPDLTAELRTVTIDRSNGSETVIAQGLVPGENVVTVGQIRLSPGTKVILPKPEQEKS